MCGEKGRGLDVPDPRSGPLIHEGSKVAEHEFPWQAGVIIDGVGFRGGATIISPSYVLSAGHVVFWGDSLKRDKKTRGVFAADLPKLGVIVGSRDRRETQRKGVKSVKLHPNYEEVFGTDLRRAKYDFVLLELDSPLHFNQSIKPACPGTEKA